MIQDITPLPEPPTRAFPTLFAQRADAFLSALPTFAVEMNQASSDIEGIEGDIVTARDTATAAASAAEAARDAAVITANVTVWSSGTPYVQYASVIDPVDFSLYTAKAAVTSTTRPGLDSTNWDIFYVNKTTDQTIGGVKTFTSKPVVPAGAVGAEVPQAQAVAMLATTQLGGYRNKLINATMVINQRVYTGAAVAAGVYTRDRWKIVEASQAATFTQSGNYFICTAPVGGVMQVIEGVNISAGTYVLSYTGTSTCTVNGTPRVSGESFTLPANTDVNIIFVNGTVSLPQLELGTVPSAFEWPEIGSELLRCQRYYSKSYAPTVAVGTPNYEGFSAMGIATASTRLTTLTRFPVTMRVQPTVTLYSTLGAAGQYSGTNAYNSLGAASLSGGHLSEDGFHEIAVVGATVGTHYQCHWVASAEL